jgi:hypothetical protein
MVKSLPIVEGSSLAWKYSTSVEVIDSDEHSIAYNCTELIMAVFFWYSPHGPVL